MQIVVEPKKLARQVRKETFPRPHPNYIPDYKRLPVVKPKNGLYTIRDFDFCAPRLWSSGKATAERIIINVLNDPNMHDYLIIRYYFGAERLLKVWDDHSDFFKDNDYAVKYLTPIFDNIRKQLAH